MEVNQNSIKVGKFYFISSIIVGVIVLLSVCVTTGLLTKVYAAVSTTSPEARTTSATNLTTESGVTDNNLVDNTTNTDTNGTDLEQEGTVQGDEKTTTADNNSNQNLWIWIVLGVIGVLIIGGLVFLLKPNKNNQQTF